MSGLALVCALGIVVMGAAPPQRAPKAIAIVINGDALPLNPPPRFDHDVLMVPVRRTIEAFGLQFNRQGHMIWTQVGSKTVSLTLGSRVAHVDGDVVYLDTAPVEVKDVLYAPLRFFSDVLGAQASYDKKQHAVQIVAQLVGRTSEGFERAGAQLERYGTVSAVDIDSDPPTLTLVFNANVRTIPIGANAIIDMHDVAANVVSPGELGDVRPGDFARVFMNKRGHVERIEDAFGSRYGTIAAATTEEFVLADGHVVEPSRTSQISLNGKPVQMSDLKVGDVVSVRYNVETNEVRSILVSRAIAQTDGTGTGPHIASVSIDADHPLRPGDTVNVTMQGTPGGAATFDIGPYMSGLAMAEHTPGTYVGSYELPNGSNFSDVPVIGHLRVGAADATDVAANRELSSAANPPGIADFAPGEGARVNTDRPAIFATFAAGAVPVNPSSVVLWVDGRDVTADCIRTEQFIQYMPAYSYRDGAVRVTVRVADKAGNTTTKSWTFTIHR